MNPLEEKQKKAINYYDKFSKIYDWISSKSYYRKPRVFAIIYFRIVYEGGEAYLKKENGVWKIITAKRTWIE